MLANVQRLRAAKDEVMPGDNVPRRVRLVQALHSLAKFCNSSKSYEKADQFYVETIALISGDKSERGLSELRNYSNSTALDYMERGDLVTAKEYIDIALKICREDSREREVLPSVLTTLARWQRQMKQTKDAESTLLEAIGILGRFGFSQRKELAGIYLETNQLPKANETISELEKSTYADSSVVFLRANWLRAMGKTGEADELDTKALAMEVKEREHMKNSQ